LPRYSIERALAPDHVVVFAYRSEAGEWADGKARELFNADAAEAALQGNCVNQALLLPAVAVFRK
jgi:hypothetical protein